MSFLHRASKQAAFTVVELGSVGSWRDDIPHSYCYCYCLLHSYTSYLMVIVMSFILYMISSFLQRGVEGAWTGW